MTGSQHTGGGASRHTEGVPAFNRLHAGLPAGAVSHQLVLLDVPRVLLPLLHRLRGGGSVRR